MVQSPEEIQVSAFLVAMGIFQESASPRIFKAEAINSETCGPDPC